LTFGTQNFRIAFLPLFSC